MTCKFVIEHFAGRTALHIRVRDVRDLLVSGKIAVKDRIMFYGVEMDVSVVRGFLHEYMEKGQYVLLDGRMADIYYDSRQPIEWQRLVCCKELLHILDPEGYTTATREKVKDLIEKISLPPGLANTQTDGDDVWGDRLKDLQALAILFPMAARNELLPAYREEKITAENIARIARLPERYIRWVMSERWEKIYPGVLGM